MVATVLDLWAEMRSGCWMWLVSHGNKRRGLLGLGRVGTGKEVGLPKPVVQAHRVICHTSIPLISQIYYQPVGASIESRRALSFAQRPIKGTWIVKRDGSGRKSSKGKEKHEAFFHHVGDPEV